MQGEAGFSQAPGTQCGTGVALVTQCGRRKGVSVEAVHMSELHYPTHVKEESLWAFKARTDCMVLCFGSMFLATAWSMGCCGSCGNRSVPIAVTGGGYKMLTGTTD